MEIFLIVAQFTLALSVAFVWIFRYDNVVKEFKQFGLSDLTRNFVGASKIALATLLIAGVWHTSLVLISSLLMGFFMVVAQFFHFKIKNTYLKHLPSLILLILAITIAMGSIQSS